LANQVAHSVASACVPGSTRRSSSSSTSRLPEAKVTVLVAAVVRALVASMALMFLGRPVSWQASASRLRRRRLKGEVTQTKVALRERTGSRVSLASPTRSAPAWPFWSLISFGPKIAVLSDSGISGESRRQPLMLDPGTIGSPVGRSRAMGRSMDPTPCPVPAWRGVQA